ncbi:molybdopterin-dependent oxidoreductase [Caldimonas thermodepolymerans]|uniref:Molybdopterin-binding oxidoreductase n=1 Tax=Caldimonas thermodepolymerans TaxID=215580 RepID=A0A2S5T9H3_9BURK|nr:molybdopterin-dependent oxidoreductase [Caldimonas thermodepolymerans]PPE71582.1 molybdopterin-binding oxidoreductase [Caldimonas thermodepolymerans]QPC30606.1 molybdopterin-dependent oxidoreductase [Caldimonas thermodepolymerans]RDI02789.1 anaerobic selenocysteine-containing dehydrogenase [Caldimonas thermodepolymerans]
MDTPPATAVAHRICPVCEACCGLELQLQGERIVSIRGHAGDRFSGGYLCPKGVALKDLHEDPDRLRAPLVRRGGRFVEVGWDEAFREIEARLVPLRERHGRDALGLVIGNPTVHKTGLMLYVPRLVRAAGTHNVFTASTLDQMPKQLASGLMYGHWLTIAVPDIERCEHLLVLGANPATSNGSMWTVPDFRGKARAMQARGGRLVVVDPRRSETAALADEHLPIHPGADVHFLLGLVHTLFDEGLVRLGRLAPHVAGLEALQAAVQPYAAERVSARCGIAAEAIRRQARLLATAPRAAVYGRIGTCTQAYGTLANWLVDVLNVLTGHLDEPGGAMFPKAAVFAANTLGAPGRGRGIVTGRYRSRVSGAPEVLGEFPMGCLAEEIETPGEGQVRALITVAGNPVLSAPNGPRLAAALEQLEFMVSVDLYLNETTRHADVILPGRSPLEDPHYDVAFAQLSHRNHARYSPAVLPAAPDHPPEWQVLLRLVAILRGEGAGADLRALDDRLFAEDLQRLPPEQAGAVMRLLAHREGPERLLDFGLRSGPHGDGFGRRPDGLTLDKVMAAAPAGIDLGPLQPRVPEVLRTPSGCIELAPAMLLEDLARVEADLAQPVPELVLVGRRQVRSNNSWMHNLPVLAKGPYRCTLLVHPDDARRLGLRDGAPARIEANGRAIEAPVEVSEEMRPGVVSLPHGWGHGLPGTRMAVAAERPGANLNALLDEAARDPLSGTAVLSGVPVRLTAAG